MTADVAFYGFGALAIVGALGLVFERRNTFVAVLSFAVCLFSLAAEDVLLEAYWVAAVQLLVGAAAIPLAVLGVVMTLNLRDESYSRARGRPFGVMAAVIAAFVVVGFVTTLAGGFGPAAATEPGFGAALEIGRLLWTDWVLAFALTSLLLLAAIVGLVALSGVEDE